MYREPETLPECEERHYWRKRFNFASWLFLGMAMYAIFFDKGFWAAFIGLTASVGFNLFDSWMQIRHLKWHITNLEEENNDGEGNSALH